VATTAVTATSPDGKRGFLNTLVGVRGIGATVVFIGHCGMEPVYKNHEINNRIIHVMAGIGEASVTFFFLISGFVLVWVWRASDTPRTFMRRRLVKIFPMHLVTFSVGLVLMIAFGEFVGVWNVLPNLPLLQVWFPSEKILEGANGPSWSLSVELFFYCLFPLMLGKVSRIPTEKLWRWVYATIGVIVLITVLVAIFVPSEPKALDQPVALYQFYILVFVPPVRLFDFLLGMLICRIILTDQWRPVRWRWIVLGFGVAWFASYFIPAPLGFVAPFVVPLFLLTGAAAARDVAGLESVVTSRYMLWLGDASFGFYMVHWLVLHYGRLSLGGGPWNTMPATAFLVACWFVSVFFAGLLHKYVELPSMRRWSRKKRPKPQLAQPQPSAEPQGASASVAVHPAP
jgi:peptidoglycan/LPS O-acetylase OafA/YrhL